MLAPPLSDSVGLHHGDKIWTHARTLGVERHYGIWDAEFGKVLHNTHPGGVQYISLGEFSNREVFVEKRASVGHERQVVERARALMGRQYNLVSFNCEHYASVVHEGKKESPQLQRATVVTCVVGAFGFLWSRAANAPVYNDGSGRYHDRRTGRFVAR